MRIIIWTSIITLFAHVCFAQGNPRIKLTQLEQAKTVESSKAGQIGLSNSAGDQRYAQYVEIDLVAIGFVPTATGNTSNYSEFVTASDGTKWYIDWQGRGYQFLGSATDKNGYYGGNLGNGGDQTVPSVTKSTLTNQLTFYRATDDAGGLVPIRIEVAAGNEPEFQSFKNLTDSMLIHRSDQEFELISTTGLNMVADDVVALVGDSLQFSGVLTESGTGQKTFLTIKSNDRVKKQLGINLADLNFSMLWTDGTEEIYPTDLTDNVSIGTVTANAKLDVTTNALGVTQTNTSGIVLSNNTAAAAGAQQISPALRWRGSGWKTTATAASQTVDFIADVLPIEGTTSPTGIWQLKSSINGGAYSEVLEINPSKTAASASMTFGRNKTNAYFYLSSNTNSNYLGNENGSGILAFTNAIDFRIVNTQALYIDAARNVGIGTATPAVRLHISTGAAVTTAIQRWENSSIDFDLFGVIATPESAVTGSPGDLANGTVGGVGSLYLKETGAATNTGWKQVITTSSNALLPTGTNTQTLRHNGTSWIANSTIVNDGTRVAIGTTTFPTRYGLNLLGNLRVNQKGDFGNAAGRSYSNATISINDSTSATPSIFAISNRHSSIHADAEIWIRSTHGSAASMVHWINAAGEGAYHAGTGDTYNSFRFCANADTSIINGLVYSVNSLGKIGIHLDNPTAQMQFAAQTTAAESAPIKLIVGPPMTTPEDGALQYINTDVDNLAFTVGSDLYILMKGLTTAVTMNFPSTATMAQSFINATVTGAQTGDRVIVAAPTAAQIDGVQYVGQVSAANTVRVGLYNFTGGAVDPASADFNISVIH